MIERKILGKGICSKTLIQNKREKQIPGIRFSVAVVTAGVAIVACFRLKLD